jgi:hypothetical protein
VIDVAEIVVPWVFLTLALFALVDWDESRLDPIELERAWPPATRSLALAYVGLVSLPVHFWRTRRSFTGTLQGLAWAVGAFGIDWAATELVDLLPEWALPWAMGTSLAGFTGAMIWRSRRGGWWYSGVRAV